MIWPEKAIAEQGLVEGSELGLSEYRGEVEKIDYEILKLIEARAKLARKIFEAKRSQGLDIVSPEQESIVMKRAMDMATELNLDAGAVRDIFAILIRMSVDKQLSLSGKDGFP